MGSRPKDRLVQIGTDTRGDAKLAAESVVCGKWRGALGQRLRSSASNLHCTEVSYRDWRRSMFEKLIFECAVNLVGALHNFQSVEAVARREQTPHGMMSVPVAKTALCTTLWPSAGVQ